MLPSSFDNNRVRWGSYLASFFWLVIWMLNGYFTVIGVQSFGRTLVGVQYPPIAAIGGFLTNTVIAMLIHFSISTIEGTVWYTGWNLKLWATYILVMFVDVGTTFIGIQNVSASLNLGFTEFTSVCLAFGFSLIPEILMFGHLRVVNSGSSSKLPKSRTVMEA